MSLISDALKTAQRQRSGRGPDEPQPLLDGFFPYVSTTPAKDRPRLSRVIAISLSSVVILGVTAWFSAPMIKRALTPRQQKPGFVLPPPAGRTPTTPTVAAAAATDSQASVRMIVDSTPTLTVDQPVRTKQPAPRVTSGTDQTVIRAINPGSARQDTAIARPEEKPTIGSATTTPASTKIDYEAQGTALFNVGDLQGAREKFLLATRYAPTARAWTNYGITLQKLGELSAASAAYQAAIGRDANYLEAWLWQGRVAILMGRTQDAIPLFQRARSIDSRHGAVNTELAELEWNAKNWTEARRFAEEAIRADRSNYRAHYFLASSADQLGDVDTAVREYTAYLQTVGTAERDNLASVGFARMRLQLLKGKS